MPAAYKTALQKLRREAGYKSAAAYADHMGYPRTSYTEYEQGRAALPLERAWAIADDLGVTLDALVGRTPPAADTPARQRELARLVALALLDIAGDGANDGR